MTDRVIDPAQFRSALLDWYDANRRTLAWRSAVPDPYRVWLSEIMLQQTTVPHATPYFLEFTRRWPSVEALAAAPDAEVMAAWAGLGYYARARNLLACARVVASEHGGRFPDTEEGLRRLPGVGAYTAAAVASIAFGRPANVVDGNVERVMARVFAVETPLPTAKPELTARASLFVTGDRPGDWAQALMDLGATTCRPKSPLCERCPVAAFCEARARGQQEAYPKKSAKADRPRRYGVAYVRLHEGRVALEQRPSKGLLGGMLGLPTSDWTSAPPPVEQGWRDAGEIEHVFTHFALTLRVVRAESAGEAEWLDVAKAQQALPSVFRKALMKALSPSP
jgi:A/G-specific adenine glycosylase